jgi:hypothetical protein
LSPFLRQNVTHTLIFRVTNEKLLESVYEELISMTGHFPRFRDFKQVYNQHTCSSIEPTTGEITKNYNGMCINNAIGCLDWNLGDWFPEETKLLKTFLDAMKIELDEERLPAPADDQNLKEIVPEMVENVHGAIPVIRHHRQVPMTPALWRELKGLAVNPGELITNPVHRNLFKRKSNSRARW